MSDNTKQEASRSREKLKNETLQQTVNDMKLDLSDLQDETVKLNRSNQKLVAEKTSLIVTCVSNQNLKSKLDDLTKAHSRQRCRKIKLFSKIFV